LPETAKALLLGKPFIFGNEAFPVVSVPAEGKLQETAFLFIRGIKGGVMEERRSVFTIPMRGQKG